MKERDTAALHIDVPRNVTPVCDANGKPLDGYVASGPINGDSLRHVVTRAARLTWPCWQANRLS